jgi:Fe2+ transport system protein FeoA
MLNLGFTRFIHSAMKSPVGSTKPIEKAQTLAQARAGKLVTITGFGKLTSAQKQHLQAFGLLPGRTIQVLAQHPVTIVLVEQTELAFEWEIARQVMVE